MEGQSKRVHVWERCYQRGRAGSSKEGVFGQGEVETSAVATHLGDIPGGSEASEPWIDSLKNY